MKTEVGEERGLHNRCAQFSVYIRPLAEESQGHTKQLHHDKVNANKKGKVVFSLLQLYKLLM